jgi:hypothetical protein
MERPVIHKLASLLACLSLSALLVTCGGGGASSTGDTSSPGGGPAPGLPPTSQDYVVFAWNDLGMHCLNPSYDQAVILPPYNTVWAQVIKRGNPPQVVTSGLSVDYRLLDNTKSATKGQYGQFWVNAAKLFGITLATDTGLNLEDPAIHNGLSGSMVVKGNHFQVNGIPATPINDAGVWNPFQVAEVTVKDGSSAIRAQTRATVPTSDEINCGKCHNTRDANPLKDILLTHDAKLGTSLAARNAPVLCAECHGSPALGTSGAGTSGKYLSQAIHGFHASQGASCYDCHPGTTTQCSRSVAHMGTVKDGNCTSCHGDMANVSATISSGRIPWASEPKCGSCHTASNSPTKTTVAAGVISTIPQVDTGTDLYRNAQGHGGVSCAACHGSPHAMVPSTQASDNYQAHQYMGSLPKATHPEQSMGSCAVCHGTSKPTSSVSDWAEEHASGRTSACNVCHTGFQNPSNAANWPHGFQWRGRP